MARITVLLCILLLFLFPLSCFSNDDGHGTWPGDDWQLSSPEKEGMNAIPLKEMDEYIKKNLRQASSALLVRHGYVVFEKYYTGSKDDLRDVRSVTKSVISAIIGVAIKNGYIKSIDEKMIDYFPEYVNDLLDPSVRKLSIRHLLTMSAGFKATPDPGVLQDLLTLPLSGEPGLHFEYNENDPLALSLIITKATKLKAADFAKKKLFEPIGISFFKWNDIDGYSTGADGLYLRSRDMARIGYLFLREGQWETHQIIHSEWIQQSARGQVRLPELPEYKDEYYGFLWWCRTIRGYQSYYAHGLGGQVIFVVPALDIVFVSTSRDVSVELPFLVLIESYVFPAILN